MRVLTAILVAVLWQYTAAQKECISGSSFYYQGKQSTTKNGLTCQRWDTNVPHEVKTSPQDGGKHNYCRNPDNDVRGTWCYTTDPSVRWAYCGIPKCDENVLAIWAGFDIMSNTSVFGQMKADPEYMSQNDDYVGNFNKKSFYDAELKALDVDRDGKKIYFTDVKNNYFGIYDMETSETKRYMEGMALEIHAISQDWVTGNFYWTDCRTMNVMVADESLKTQVPIYRAAPFYPKAIVVLQEQRKLVFSKYMRKNERMRDTQIVITDLAGQNEKVLFKYPDVIDVTGLAADDKRIYWTDNLGYASRVMSSRFDGSDKIEHYTEDSASFFDLDVYSDYIYVTDTLKRYNYFDDYRYNIKIIGKKMEKIQTTTRATKPFGVAILSEKEVLKSSRLFGSLYSNSCHMKCGGVCLPKTPTTQKCVCAPGYRLNPKTRKCVAKLLADNFVIALDKSTGKARQLPLRENQGKTFSIVPLGKNTKIGCITMDASTKRAYYYDTVSKEIKRGTLTGKENVMTKVESPVKFMEYDPVAKLLFYVDANNDISILSFDGVYKKIIVKNTDQNTDIKMIAIDMKQKYLYWTDTKMNEGEGKVYRCRFDGSGKEVVLDGLSHPHGISIDCSSNKLYVLDAESVTIYEISLAKLLKITPKVAKMWKKYNFRDLVSNRRYSLAEMKVYLGYAYVTDEEQLHLLKYKLGASGKDAITEFGPDIFYKQSSLSLYSKNLYKKNIASIPEFCKKKKCKSFCVSTSKKKAKCLKA